MRTVFLRAALSTVLLLSAPLFADALFLKNGEVVQGTIVSQSRTEIRINTGTQVRSVPKADISRVTFGSAEEEIRRAEAQRRLEQERREAQRREEEKRRKTDDAPGFFGSVPWRAAARSAILPGWGLYQTGQERSAWAAFGLFAGSVSYSYVMRRRAENAKADYDRTSVMSKLTLAAGGSAALPFAADSAAKRTYAARVAGYNQSLGILAAVYVMQISYTMFLGKGTAGTVQVEPAESGVAFRPALSLDAPVPGRRAGVRGTLVFSLSY